MAIPDDGTNQGMPRDLRRGTDPRWINNPEPGWRGGGPPGPPTLPRQDEAIFGRQMMPGQQSDQFLKRR